MQSLEVSCALRRTYTSLGAKGLTFYCPSILPTQFINECFMILKVRQKGRAGTIRNINFLFPGDKFGARHYIVIIIIITITIFSIIIIIIIIIIILIRTVQN